MYQRTSIRFELYQRQLHNAKVRGINANVQYLKRSQIQIYQSLPGPPPDYFVPSCLNACTTFCNIVQQYDPRVVKASTYCKCSGIDSVLYQGHTYRQLFAFQVSILIMSESVWPGIQWQLTRRSAISCKMSMTSFAA